jgi:hypothetical protein
LAESRIAHAGDLVFAEIEAHRPLLARVLGQIHRATNGFGEPQTPHSGLLCAAGWKMLVKIGGAVFDDQRRGEWFAGGRRRPCVHEVHQRLHIADHVVPRESDRGRVVGELGDAHLAERPESPSRRGTVDWVDEP